MFSCKNLLLLVSLLLSNLCFADGFRILLTNDDGIDSPLLIALATHLSDDYDVVVSAPRENQSGSSHASDSSSPLKVETIYRSNRLFGYGVHGRPADAARFGILSLGKDDSFDLVISGINRGANVGNVAHLSGTVGAAMEGLYHGIPALAVSQDSRADTQITLQLTLQTIKHIQQQPLPAGTLLSINVPAGEVTEVVVKPMGGSYLGFRPYTVVEQEGEATVYQGGLRLTDAEPQDNDTRAYLAGKATITPLKLDWTDYPALSTLADWEFELAK